MVERQNRAKATNFRAAAQADLPEPALERDAPVSDTQRVAEALAQGGGHLLADAALPQAEEPQLLKVGRFTQSSGGLVAQLLAVEHQRAELRQVR